jgi:hypothetical protein
MSRVEEFGTDLKTTNFLLRAGRDHLERARAGLTGGGIEIVAKARKLRMLEVGHRAHAHHPAPPTNSQPPRPPDRHMAMTPAAPQKMQDDINGIKSIRVKEAVRASIEQ